MKKTLIVLLLGVLTVPLMAGFDCKYDSNRQGTVKSSYYVELGPILWAHPSSGHTTKIRWPEKFYAPNLRTTWSRTNLHTNYGNFVLKLKVKLAGNKKFGVWLPKRNRVIVKILDSNGNVVAQKTLDKRVRAPHTYTITLSKITGNCSNLNPKYYTLELNFHKWDGESNDGTCTYEFAVGGK